MKNKLKNEVNWDQKINKNRNKSAQEEKSILLLNTWNKTNQ